VPEIATPVVDLAHPSGTRVRDYLLGGSAHWAVDREFSDRILDGFPQFRDITRASRMFGNRVVRHLLKRGVRQFLDISSAVLSATNTHQVANEIDPESRVVYVENEPIALAHAEFLLDEEGDPDRHAIVNLDLRYPDKVWEAALATGIFDLAEPVAVLLFAVLHRCEPGADGDDPAARAVARYRELLPAGSYLALSHSTNEGIPAELSPKLAEVKELFANRSQHRIHSRTHAEIEALFGNLEIIDPGVVWTPQWCPEETGSREPPVQLAAPNYAIARGGVGLKI
jgi:hypothetical protein